MGETEYTCKKYIIGEAIKKLGELEDILESWHIENLEELKTRLHDCQVYHLENNSNETLIHNLKNELADLKQQIAEKDEEIEELNDKLEWKSKWLKIADNMVGHYEKSNQDKISFAVEQLEKVKGLIANHTQELWTCENDDIDLVLYEEIDNQINELKEGK